jgi:protein-S-isoprenylcysteine O-methyltransferase Ste14
MPAAPFLFLSSDAQTAYTAVLGVHWVSEMMILRKTGPARNEDRGSFRLLRIMLPLSWLVGAVGVRIPQPTFGGPVLFYCAMSVMIAGQLLRWWSVATLGRFFTVNVSILEGHHVVDSGPYRFVRHPSYTAILLIYFGAALCLGNAVSLIGVMLLSGLALLNRIQVEEQVLQAALGEPYRMYMQRTRRLIPGIY